MHYYYYFFFHTRTNWFTDVAISSMAEPVQTAAIHVANYAMCFLLRMRLNFPFTGVVGGTSCASVHSQ